MRPERFISHRQADWKKLESLLDMVGKERQRLTPADAELMGDLYRGISSDLALAQRTFPQHKITRYLNQLVGRSHAAIYTKQTFSGRGLWHFFAIDVPRTFRRQIVWFQISLTLFFLPALIVGLLTGYNPDAARFVLPPDVQNLIPLIEEQALWTDIEADVRPIFASGIMTNNIQVSFLAFAGGMTAGVLTFYAMVFNGILVGGLLGLTSHHGIGFGLLTFTVAHGVVELSVIFMAGAAGLMIGWAILRPGPISRLDAIRLAAREGVKLIIICVPLLVITGLIEGFISPAENIPWPVKFAVGIVTGGLLYAWLFLGGRSE